MTQELETEAMPAGLSLQEYLAILRRRRAIILQAFVFILVLGVVITLLTKPVYQSTAKLLVEGPSYNLNTVDSSNPLSSLFELSQQQTVDTQVEVLQAQPLMDEVQKQVGKVTLSVSEVKETNVIQVTGEANDPQRAAAAPNKLLDLYINEDVDQHLGELETARQFVLTQGQQAHAQLNASESALEGFKQRYHVADLTKNREDQITRVTALTDAAQADQTNLAAMRAQIAASQALLAKEPPTLSAKLSATNTEVNSLKDQIRTLQVQREGMVQPGGDTSLNPQVRAIDAEIAALQARLAAEPPLAVSQTSVVNSDRQALAAKIVDMQAQLASLQTQATKTAQDLAQAQAAVGKYAAWEVALDRLTRQHDDAETQDKMFSDKLSDLTLREKARHAEARVIAAAPVPTEPVRPKKAMNILLAAFLGLFVGVCLALLQEYLDDRINTAEDADRVLGLPSLGHVPALTATDARLLPQMKGMDPAAESYRILRASVNFASIDAPLRTMVVTSSNPGEGKTTTAANLAFAMAADGRKVIIVDTDLRRPSLHKLLELPTVPGLTDVLLGTADLENTLLEHADMPGLMALTCGTTPPNPSELLGSRRFRDLTTQLTELADIVIFDSPPVLAAADALILASQMDGTVLVVEAGETKKGAARRVLTLLRNAHANVLGVAYNKMRETEGSAYYYSLAARKALRKLGKPYVVYTHGMLDPWFKHTYPLKHLKKCLYWPWGEYPVLRDAKAVCFTCEEERLLARQSFTPYRCHEAVVSYGTAAPAGDPDAQRTAFLTAYPHLRGKRLLLFLSRIHAKKGCDLLMDAFAQVAPRDPALHLVMAGPDQTGLQAQLQQQAQRLGVADRLTWTGMISGDVKYGAFLAAEAFVLPSHQENFGIAVAEALACGLPVLISNKVNIWREIEADGAGLVADDTAAATTQLLQTWLSLPPERRQAMARQARTTFQTRFEISQAARGLLNVLRIPVEEAVPCLQS